MKVATAPGPRTSELFLLVTGIAGDVFAGPNEDVFVAEREPVGQGFARRDLEVGELRVRERLRHVIIYPTIVQAALWVFGDLRADNLRCPPGQAGEVDRTRMLEARSEILI